MRGCRDGARGLLATLENRDGHRHIALLDNDVEVAVTPRLGAKAGSNAQPPSSQTRVPYASMRSRKPHTSCAVISDSLSEPVMARHSEDCRWPRPRIEADESPSRGRQLGGWPGLGNVMERPVLAPRWMAAPCAPTVDQDVSFGLIRREHLHIQLLPGRFSVTVERAGAAARLCSSSSSGGRPGTEREPGGSAASV